jgi:murein DD-endopeptidase MepM/ murein hydrolase activator NlpD
MSQQFDPREPLPDHLADTGPIRRVNEVASWRRVVGFVSLLGAAALTIATALLLLRPTSVTPNPDSTAAPTNSVELTAAPTTAPDVVNPVLPPVDAQATLSPDSLAALLSTPVAILDQPSALVISRDDYNPFTIIPDRPRSEVIQYEVKTGDTIFAIAERFGLTPETIAWSNERNLIESLRPGKRLNILPVDGAYVTVTAEETIQSIASQYSVDPYAIIDSEYNDLFDAEPTTELPSGTRVVIPGGVAEQINWNPVVERVPASSGSSGVGRISFDPGDPGSCGLVDNPGGGGGWVKPLGSYQWVRGFSSIHSGVDLSAAPGTPIMAANGGTVVFAGWSNWGYGWSVVLAHGPYTTLYGHMSAVYAQCGSSVSAGQVIGAVGSSGDSSGPHLHFEIRYNDVPTDPTGTMPF